MQNKVLMIVIGTMLAAGLTVLGMAGLATVIGPGAAQGMLLGTLAVAAAILRFRRP